MLKQSIMARKLQPVYFLMMLLVSFVVHSAEKELVFAADLPLDSYQPATIIAKLEKAFALDGIKFSAVNLPSNRSLSLANKGVIDGEISRVGNLHEVTNYQYNNLLRIEPKVLSVWVSVFSAKKNVSINTVNDLANYSVCYINGRKFFDKVFEPIIKPSYLVKVDTDLQAFHLLNKGRVDTVITTSVDGSDIIKAKPEFKQIREVKKLIELPIYAYINKKHAALLPELLENLTKLNQQKQ